MLAFQVRGWELVASGVSAALLAALAPRATRVTRIGDGRYAFELPLDPPPDRILAELSAAGARARVAQSDSRHARGLLRQAGDQRRRRWRTIAASATPTSDGGADEADRADRGQRVSRIGARQGALQPGVLRDPADGRVVSDRSADGRAGRQDHQGPRPGGDARSSACSSPSSSASAWSRRKSRSAASTACSPSRSSAIRSCSASTSASC